MHYLRFDIHACIHDWSGYEPDCRVARRLYQISVITQAASGS